MRSEGLGLGSHRVNPKYQRALSLEMALDMILTRVSTKARKRTWHRALGKKRSL